MKLDRLETHDRLLDFRKQKDLITEGCEDCIRNRPPEYGNHPFYIFAHKRTLQLDEKISVFNEDLKASLLDARYIRKYHSLANVPEARILWEPRLTKPKAQENSMLFRAYPPGDTIKILWIIPDKALWGQYDKGNLVESDVISESIYLFVNNKSKLEKEESDDLPSDLIKSIMLEIGHNARTRKSKTMLTT